MPIQLIDILDRARELAAMLTAIRLDELTDEGAQGVHATIARIIEQLEHAKGLAAQ